MKDRNHLRAGTDPALEIIQVRCPATMARSAEKSLLELLTSPESSNVRIYRNATTPLDLSLHLPGTASSIDGTPSPLGLRLANSLRNYGQVSHSVWTPIHPPSDDQEISR